MTTKNLTVKVLDASGSPEAGAKVRITTCDPTYKSPRMDFLLGEGAVTAPYEAETPANGTLVVPIIPSDRLVGKSFYLFTVSSTDWTETRMFKMPDKDTDIASAVSETPGFRS